VIKSLNDHLLFQTNNLFILIIWSKQDNSSCSHLVVQTHKLTKIFLSLCLCCCNTSWWKIKSSFNRETCHREILIFFLICFLIRIVGGGGGCPRGTAATYWPIVPVPVDCEDVEVGGMKCGWQEKPQYSEKICPGAILSTTNSTCQTRARTRAAAVGSQRLTA
jgi:hypothetical protein